MCDKEILDFRHLVWSRSGQRAEFLFDIKEKCPLLINSAGVIWDRFLSDDLREEPGRDRCQVQEDPVFRRGRKVTKIKNRT